MKNKPAFPCEVSVNPEGTGFLVKQTGNNSFLDPGMTLRDYFAAKAMQSFLSEYGTKCDDSNLLDVAKSSYRQADAMLKAREE